MSDILSEISTLIIEGDFSEMAAKTNAALEEGLEADKILNNGLMPGMDHIGIEFKAGNMLVPEIFRSARTMQEAKFYVIEGDMRYNAKICLQAVDLKIHLRNVVLTQGINNSYHFEDDKGKVNMYSRATLTSLTLTPVYDNE